MPSTTNARWLYDGSIIGNQRDIRDSQETNTAILDNCTLLAKFNTFMRYSACYGDRFIPRRYAFYALQNVQKLYNNVIVYEDVLDSICEGGYWRRHNYRNALNNIMGITPSRILQLSEKIVHSDPLEFQFTKAKIGSNNKSDFDWPCKPRCKPLAFPDSTHDLPGFKIYSAWSSKGHIAGSFQTDLVLWSPETNSKSVYKVPHCTAVAVNRIGDIMAIGYMIFVLKLIDITHTKGEPFRYGQMLYRFVQHTFELRCIEWDPSDQILLCGTYNGSMYLFNSHLQKLKEIRNHKVSISSIKFSSNSKYLATCDIEGNVIILLWSSCDMHTYLPAKRSVRTFIDWHPWSGTDLVICKSIPASILVIDASSKKIVAFYQRTDAVIRIDAVAFNKLSGELVVSYIIREINKCEIVVMASLSRIVDVLETHEDSVKFLLWSFNGLELATAGDDNTLTFWNFFGNRDKIKLQKLSKSNDLGNHNQLIRSSQFADILNTYVKHSKNVKI